MDIKLNEEKDCFKPVFKYYKNSTLSSIDDYNNVIDFSQVDRHFDKICKIPINHIKPIQSPIKDDFRDINDWQMYTLKDFIPGLFIIPQILKNESSKKWFNYFLNQIPFENSNTLKANISLPALRPIEDCNLRWITFGFHHNWDTKVYEEGQSPIPLLIEQFADYVSSSLGFNEFRAEAGIINYYRHNSTLCPHSDHSEPNKSAPLFSLSLGSSAIFLIGETSKSSNRIIPMYLKDSDLLIMSSECRQAFHAIPKVLTERNRSQSNRTIKRINLNIRQVY